MTRILALLFALALPASAVAEAHGEPPPDRVVDRMAVMSNVKHIDHYSERLGRNLQIFIKRSDAARADAGPLPVVYMLDADQTFPLMASYTWSLTFSEEMPPSIIVGIGYGSTAPGVNFRNTDYTVPSDVRAEAGGTDRFLDVFEHEIIPLVEAEVEADPTRRVLMGQSLGGHFVIHQALARPGLFALGIAINPAIHNSPEHFYEAVAAFDGETHKQRPFISTADGDAARFREPAIELYRRLARADSLPWCLRVEQLDDHNHLTSMPRAFRQAMRWNGLEDPPCGEIDPRLIE